VNGVEDAEVVRRDFFGLLGTRQVFAQPRENRADAQGLLPGGCRDGVLDPLPGHECRHRSTHERGLRRPLAQPGIG